MYNFNYNPTPSNSFVRVGSEAEAMAYPVAPGGSVILFDGSFLYEKTADISQLGGSRVAKYRLIREGGTPEPTGADYVTRKEFEELKEALIRAREANLNVLE